jgi:ATP-dependent Clp protease ATP-binding subunit ClpA
MATHRKHGLIGRQKELEQVCQILNEEDKRVVVIGGNSGEGKSTIAAEAAFRSDATCVVSLDLSGTWEYSTLDTLPLRERIAVTFQSGGVGQFTAQPRGL